MTSQAEHRPDVLLIGAGISGLAAAGTLARRGHAALVLERARGVGGRCATRRIQGVPVDFGLPFLHGRDPGFLAALGSVADATPIPGWPLRPLGGGVPCQPEAFEGLDERLAFREGVTRFPKHLARGLTIRLNCPVVSVEESAEGREGLLRAVLASGETLEARAVVLTPPIGHSMRLLAPLATRVEAVRALEPVLKLVRMIPCLSVMARYAEGAPRPDWDVFYPDTTTLVHSILHDSSKRTAGTPLCLVVQGHAGFSRDSLAHDPEEWSRDLLWEAGEFLGRWVESPGTVERHAWTHARVVRSTELSEPLVLRLPHGALLGLCGDAFSPAGGAEGAWLSGVALASKLDGALAS